MESEKGQRIRDLTIQDYSKDYKAQYEDSPRESRSDVHRNIMRVLREGKKEGIKVLNIGSGPQELERELRQSYNTPEDKRLIKSATFATIDFASIQPERLRGSSRFDNIHHVRADGIALPFGDASFDIVVSNMAIDMMPREAIAEAGRVLTPGGTFVFTFHHPNMMRAIAARAARASDREVVQYGLDQGRYFENPEQITEALKTHALAPDEIRKREDSFRLKGSEWWLVRGRKVLPPSL